jgi:hypothetical protein
MSALIVPQRGVAATLFSYVGARPRVLQSYTHFAQGIYVKTGAISTASPARQSGAQTNHP